VLAEFPSVVDAVKCAVEVQRELTEHDTDVPEDHRIQYRIGINLGDIVIDGDDILGDGVNVAARLEGLAKPGGICISGAVYDQLAGKLDIAFEDAGEQTVKNVARPVRVWLWPPSGATKIEQPPNITHDPPKRPSIAVLPFENISGDPEQEFFADGMAEDIAAGLSKFRWLFVVARNSAFAFKGQAADVREVANKLGARYLLEGGIRRAGTKIRVTSQLIDAETGNHVWAQKFDRDVEDLFAVQDEVTSAIIGALAPEISQAEIERVRRKPPDSLDAWGLYQKGLALYPSGVKEDFKASIDFFDRAVAAEPDFVDAIAMAAHVRTRYTIFFSPEKLDELTGQARELLQRALRLDPRNSTCHAALGRLHSQLFEHRLAISMCREAVILNPNSSLAHIELAVVLMRAGEYEPALEHFDVAHLLSPQDPDSAARQVGKSISLFNLRRFHDCIDLAQMASRSPNPRYWADAVLVACFTILGQTNNTEAAKKLLLDRRPDFKISLFKNWSAIYTDEFRAALRKAGLPE
jgi:adenylate cyclase